MNTPEIKSTIEKIIRPYLDPASRHQVDEGTLTGNEHLKNDLNVDSADIVEIVLDLETEFKISIEDGNIEKIATLGDVVNLVESKLVQRA